MNVLAVRRFLVLVSALFLAIAPRLSAVPPPKAWPEKPFEPVTVERITGLPAADQIAWQHYWAESVARLRLLPPRKVPDFSPLRPLDGLPKGGAHTRGLRFDERAKWYASGKARVIADRIVAAQSPVGAWTKGNDYTARSATPHGEPGDLWSGGTFDNEATIRELQYLARVVTAASQDDHADRWRAAFSRGLDYCFAAQYPNGGFPQVYPLAGGYHDAITFNDDAMANILSFLRDVAAGTGDYGFVSAAQRHEAATRFARGIECILATQLKSRNGERTIWCQQYDALTLAPCAARNFEPIAACAAESAGLLDVLMRLPHPSPAVIAAVDAGVAWLKQAALRDVTWSRTLTSGSGLVATGHPSLLWARFYELDSFTPIFGDRDRTIHYAVTELSPERRLGYSWYSTRPEQTLELHTTWRSRLAAK